MNSFGLIRATKSSYFCLIITYNVHCSIASVGIKAYTLRGLYSKGDINNSITVYSLSQDWITFSIIEWSTQNPYFCEESIFKWTCCYIASIDMMTCAIWTRTLFGTTNSITRCRRGKSHFFFISKLFFTYFRVRGKWTKPLSHVYFFFYKFLFRRYICVIVHKQLSPVLKYTQTHLHKQIWACMKEPISVLLKSYLRRPKLVAV